MGFVKRAAAHPRVRGFDRGFTLIEVMLVLVIVSVMYSMVALSLSGTEQAQFDAETARLQKLVQGLSREALLRRGATGLAVDDQGYQGMVFDQLSRQWVAAQGRLFKRHEVHDAGLTVALIPAGGTRSATAQERPEGWPAIVFDSAGIGSPFTLRLSSGRNPDVSVTLAADGFGHAVPL